MKWLNGYKRRLTFFGFIVVIVLCDIDFANGVLITIGPEEGCDYGTIQVGIDAANNGDTVLVAPSEYVITEPITFRGKAIIVKSEAGSDQTTIRMGTPVNANRGSVVVFENNETDESVLEGFTITGGSGGIRFDASSGTVSNCSIVHNTAEYAGGIFCAHPCSPRLIGCIIAENSAPGGSGGGVFIWDGVSLTLINCIIMDNLAKDFGGGLCCYNNASMTLTDCIISGNSITGATALLAGYGGGISCTENSSLTLTNCTISKNSAGFSAGGVMCYKSSATLKDCCIEENSAARLGGAIFCETDSSMSITNCIISGNSASQRGGGIECYLNSSIALTNCTIWGNSAGQSGGGLDTFNRSSVLVTNSIVMGNTSPQGRQLSVRNPSSTLTIAYCNIAGGQGGINMEGGCTLDWDVGNIDVDPYFADPDNDDYHLKSQAGRWDPNNQSWIQDDVTSPCIDAGDPVSDWKAELWPHGVRVNMGAYGGTLQASRSLSDAGNAADLNRDGIVDSIDICIMVDHWSTDESYCDIAPVAFGDGVVDVQDMIILADNLFMDYRLDIIPMIAYWKLDETEGTIASDNTGNHYATLNGNPTWLAAEGKLDGALAFDGVDDYVSTPFVLNAMNTTFSVFAWIKGGESGQVIISQTNGTGFGATWLGTDAQQGKLMTSLMDPQPSLISESIITDGQWHHIGLVWDGTCRYLYVDGAEVARDVGVLGFTIPCDGGLYIGAENELNTGAFFSGLIDDIRIYGQAIDADVVKVLVQ